MHTKTRRQKTKQGFKVFFKIIAEYKGAVIFFAIFGVLSSIINGAMPYISGKLFDSILDFDSTVAIFGSHYHIWAVMLAFWLLAQVILRIIDSISSRKREIFARDLEANYMLKAIKKLSHLPLSFFKQNKLGETLRRVNSASDRLESAMNMIFDIAPDILSIIFGFIFVFAINYTFGLIMLLVVILYALVVFYTLAPASQLRHAIFKKYDIAYGNFYDAMGNIKIVKQSGQEEYEEKRFRHIVDQARGMYRKVVNLHERVNLFQKFSIVVMQFSVFFISVYAIHRGQISIGDLFAVNGYTAMILGPFTQMSRWWNWLSDCLVSLVRVEKIFGHKDEEYFPFDSEKINKISGNISFRNVSFSYIGGNDEEKKKDKTDVLKGVSFEIKKGQTVALVGKSGVGKTTIADLVSGFYFPQKGKILVDGHDTRSLPLHLLRKNIAVVSQDIVIFNESIKYNIRYGQLGIDERGVISAAKEAGAHEFIKGFKKKYNQLVGERGVKLSGGQRQRIAIAQAILKNAQVLILDEPTSALDAQTENIVTKSLEKLMKGKTTIIIAHRLATVRKADKIIVLEKGRVVEEGKHIDLIKKRNGAYRKFYELQKL
ncbi:ABC transporter ATP-binding protein [Candidatus Microgenomates bacterium]|nr:ABC transporter ATP-binding protein [Candidatus Microgenomates bacterium]